MSELSVPWLQSGWNQKIWSAIRNQWPKKRPVLWYVLIWKAKVSETILPSFQGMGNIFSFKTKLDIKFRSCFVTPWSDLAVRNKDGGAHIIRYFYIPRHKTSIPYLIIVNQFTLWFTKRLHACSNQNSALSAAAVTMRKVLMMTMLIVQSF